MATPNEIMEPKLSGLKAGAYNVISKLRERELLLALFVLGELSLVANAPETTENGVIWCMILSTVIIISYIASRTVLKKNRTE